MSTIEWIAVAFGLACVILTVRQNIWCWPIGIVQVCLYLYVFLHARLYSDALLQGIYVPMQIYGWWAWLHGGRDRSPLPVRVLPASQFMGWLLVSAAGAAALGTLMARATNAALPYWDAAATVLSLVAQWLLGRKVLQSWVLWIIVDVLSIGIYAAKGLYPTLGLYSVYLVLACAGLWTWQKARALETLAAPRH